MRAPSLLLSFALLPVAVVGAPVVTAPAPDPRPVPPVVQEVALDGTALRTAAATTGARTVVLTAEQATRPFSVAGVTWRPDPAVGDVVVQVRTRTEGAWTGWTALEAEGTEVVADTPDAARARAGTEPLFAGESDGVQVRVDVLSGAAPTDVRLSLIDPGESAADVPAGGTLGSSTATAAAARPVIRTRAEWGADESIRKGSPSYSTTVEAVTIHHTASTNDYTAADVPGMIRGFYAYHVTSMGWSDIGYNVLVDKFGTAWEGRAGGLDKPVVGAHAGGFNTDTAGVSMIGTYGDVEPTTVMKETVAQVSAWKLGLHGRDPKGSVTLTSRGSTRYPSGQQVTLPRIFGHRDVSSTACPGQKGYAGLPALRDRAAVLAAAGGGTAAPAPAPDPFGELERVEPGVGSAKVTGWAIDPDASTWTTVSFTADGAPVGAVVASASRPDIAERYPRYSPNHGFATTVAVAPGRRVVCATARNQGAGRDVQLGCQTVEVAAPPPPPTQSSSGADPFGSVDEIAPARDVLAVRTRGWVIDPDAATHTTVAVVVDGVPGKAEVADDPRPDVQKVHPQYSAEHGFDLLVAASPGPHTVCVRAVNQGAGRDVEMRCGSVVVPPLVSTSATPPGPRSTTDACPDGKVPAAPFTDTRTSAHRAGIDCAVWWRVAAGTSPTTFAPDRTVTREQFATFLAKTISASGGSLPASPPDAFDDDRGSVHEHAINQVAALGLVQGKGDRRYDPRGVVTRAQTATYLVRTVERRTGAPLPEGADWYRDDDGDVHEKAIGKAARAGLTGGTAPGTYAPRTSTSRAQVATFLTRVLDLLVDSGRTARRA